MLNILSRSTYYGPKHVSKSHLDRFYESISITRVKSRDAKTRNLHTYVLARGFALNFNEPSLLPKHIYRLPVGNFNYSHRLQVRPTARNLPVIIGGHGNLCRWLLGTWRSPDPRYRPVLFGANSPSPSRFASFEGRLPIKPCIVIAELKQFAASTECGWLLRANFCLRSTSED